MRELEEFDLLKLMLAENTAGVFSSGAGFGAEAGGPGGDVNGEFFFGNGFVPIQIVELDFGSGREPEVGALDFEKISGELRQLACAGQGCGVHQEGRQDFRVVVLAGVHIEKKIRERALQARTPALVNSESRAGDFRGNCEVEYSWRFANVPVCLGLKIELRRNSPTADFDVVSRAGTHRHGGVREVRDGEEQVALRGIKTGNTLVGLHDSIGLLY